MLSIRGGSFLMMPPFQPFRFTLIFLIGLLSLPLVSSAQTNLFQLYSSGAYSGGTGDMTNVATPVFKLQAPSGYIRVPHLSASSTISTVYNYETGKDVYWGEQADVGNYWFRGRNMYIMNGKVGVNYTSPQYPLDVAGHIAGDDLVISNKYPGNTSLDLSLTGYFNTSAFDMIAAHTGWDPNAVYVAGYNASNASVSGWTALATQHVYIGTSAFNNLNYLYVNLMNGGVGIGTTNTNDPNNRLFVETGIRTRKVTVDQAAWPDYVFSSRYRLMPLDSLAQYIESNHRLPDMPSADSVAKNGVELGDSQARLLKKLEELTLYVLQQQTELQEVKAENRRMKKQMEALIKAKKN